MKANHSVNKTSLTSAILLFIAGIITSTLSFAQAHHALLPMTRTAPVIDGIVDQVWADTQANPITLPYQSETPTLGALGETYWKGLWTMEGIYILVNVVDDVFSPPYAGTDPATSWMYDKPELYFEANYIKKEGMGPASGQGHYCYAPPPIKDQTGSLPIQFNQNGSAFCYKVTGSSYLVEYFIPFADLLDKDFLPVDKTEPIGFDITIVDNDVKTPMRNRMSWANAGAIDENWNNMDGAGIITLETGPCIHTVPIEKITLTPGSITVNKGTKQMFPILEPQLIYNDSIQWTVINQTGQASITQRGLVTAISDGTVIIKANSIQNPLVQATTTITISGQTGDDPDPWNNYNLIKNWDFASGLDQWGYWVDGGVNYQTLPEIVDGYVSMTAGQADNREFWHYQLHQSGFKAEADVPYILKFKSWSNISKLNRVVFEDTPENTYNRYGTSNDSQAINGRSEWEYKTHTAPAWYTFHVTFDQIKPNTLQKIQWMFSNANATTYLDSILLIKESDTTVINAGYLVLSATKISMEATEGNANVTIRTNINWTVSTNQSWLTVSPSSGSGHQTLTFTAQANPLLSTREAIITVLADGLEPQNIILTQKAKSQVPAMPGEPTYGENWSDEVWNEYNLLKNWNFNNNANWWTVWVETDGVGKQIEPGYDNGVISMTTLKSNDGSFRHYKFSQSWLKAQANVPYVLKFKSWSNVPKANKINFEDMSHETLYGSSTDPEAINGRSEWIYNTITEPRWYTFHVTFDQMVPTTSQMIMWMLSNADATTYLDSVILVREDDPSITNAEYMLFPASNVAMEDTETTMTFDLTSNTTWQIYSDQPWLTVTPLKGSGNQTITLNAKANQLYVNRVANLYLYSASLPTQPVIVVQKAKPIVPNDPNDSTLVEHWSPEAWNNYNLIKNWDFNSDLYQDWGGWVDGWVTGQSAPVIENGIVKMTTGMANDGTYWHYQLNQAGFLAEANVPYTLRFKSWSSIPKMNVVDFEDTSENFYNHYGASTDAEANFGRSEWFYTTTTEPQWFSFHVVFDQMETSTIQKIQWMLSNANATSYLDSVILIKDADLLLIKEAELALSASHLDVEAVESNTMVDVSSNTHSMAISDQDWVSVYPAIVSGNETLKVATKANETNKSRTATITLYPAGMNSKTITVTQGFVTGTDLLSEDQQMTIFPNPTTGKVKLVFGKIPPQGSYITVVDLTGKTIFKKIIQSKEESIDLKGNSPGIYFIKTNLKDGKVKRILLK